MPNYAVMTQPQYYSGAASYSPQHIGASAHAPQYYSGTAANGPSMIFSPTRMAIGMGVLGFMVAGTAAAAFNIRKVKKNEITREEAVVNTLKKGASAGLSTAAASVVSTIVDGGPVISLVTMAVTGTGVMYLLDSALESPVKTVEK